MPLARAAALLFRRYRIHTRNQLTLELVVPNSCRAVGRQVKLCRWRCGISARPCNTLFPVLPPLLLLRQLVHVLLPYKLLFILLLQLVTAQPGL